MEKTILCNKFEEYIHEMERIGESMRFRKDDCITLFAECKDKYYRLYSDLEQKTKQSYSKLEERESDYRNIKLQNETILRNMHDGSAINEKNLQSIIYKARIRETEAERMVDYARKEYENNKKIIDELIKIWERYSLELGAIFDSIEDSLYGFHKLNNSANDGLREYLSVIEKARLLLYDDNNDDLNSENDKTCTNGLGKAHNGYRKQIISKIGNQIIFPENGSDDVIVHIDGKEYKVPNTVLGAAKAYRIALNNDDLELAYTIKNYNNENKIRRMSEQEIQEQIKKYGYEMASSLPIQERESIHKYTGVSYANINAVLRGLEEEFDVGNLENARNIHSALSKCELPYDCILYRGVSAKALGHLDSLKDNELVGQILWDSGFLSTSLDENCAFDGDMILEINAPAGTHGLYVGYLSSAKQLEKEVLIDVDQTMRINSVCRDEIGRRHINVTII